MALEIKKIREELDVTLAELRELKQKYEELRSGFMGHYKWLAQMVHTQYHHEPSCGKSFTSCPHAICDSVRRTLEDLKQIEVDLRENNLVSAPEGDRDTEAPRSA